MPLWFAITLAIVFAFATGTSVAIAHILISLGRAAPIMRSRIGRQDLTAPIFGREPAQMTFAGARYIRHQFPGSGWAGARL